MLIAGCDEAGRGPVLGSLVFGCVVLREEDIYKLDEIGVDDSKKLTPKRREDLLDKIKRSVIGYKIREVTAEEINKTHEKGINLNELEEIQFGFILNEIDPKPEVIYIDSCDVNEERFGISIRKKLKFQPKQIISRHKADSTFKVVGAASILAKTFRDHRIEEFKQQYGEIGSGYPSDPYTKKFLEEYYQKNQKFPPIVRTWWSTAINIEKKYNSQAQKEKFQKKITDFN